VTKRARKHLEETLLPTSQPAHYLCLAQLPLTDRGKLDTEALTNSAVAVATPPSVPPRTPLEETIASVWREVLKRDAIGVQEDFFLAGGHSLLFAQVITRLRQALSLEISLRAIFLHPTIAQLAEYIEGLQRDAGAVVPTSVPDDAR
jgi:acyl carrier protein